MFSRMIPYRISLPLRGAAAVLAASLVFASAPAQAEDQRGRPFAHEISDLEADPAVTWGRLDNGLRYALMHNNEPPDRVSMRLHVAAGSIHETEAQRGLAHFLEHMAFNGTENYTSSELVEFLQTLGFAFGPDLNAYTGFDETVYMLDLPRNDRDMVAECLLVFREWADRITFDPAEIETERGVILNEKLDRDTVDFRIMERQLKTMLPDALLVERFPIGIEEVIRGAQRDEFIRFYEKHYTADRMTVVVVGDFDMEDMRGMIHEKFGDMRYADPVPEPTDMGKIDSFSKRVLHFHDEEVSSTDAGLLEVRPYQPRPDTAAERARMLPRQLALSMINRRLARLAREENAGFVSANVYAYDMLDFVEFSGIGVTAEEDDWQRALAVAENELRRALEFGFTDSEFSEATANLLRSYEEAVKSRETARSQGLVMGIVRGLSGDRVFTSAEDNLARLNETLPQITVEDCLEAFRELWTGQNRVISVTTKEEIPDAEQAILAIYEAATATPVVAPEESALDEFAYSDTGEPGTIVERRTIDDLGITQWVLSNGVRINLKPTEFERNRISMTSRFGGGLLELPTDRPGFPMVAEIMFGGGGLEAHSAEDLERIFAGKRVGVSLGIDDDAFTLSGATTPEDLGSQLRLFRAFLLHPGFREEPERQLRRQLPILAVQTTTTPEGVFGTRGRRWMAGGDPRFGIEDISKLGNYNREQVREWLETPLREAALEFSMVGDFVVEDVEDVILATLGTLPPRQDSRPSFEDQRQVRPLPTENHTISYQSQIPRTLNIVLWPSEDMSDIQLTRRLNVLGSVLNDRVRRAVREELGEAYSPRVSHSSSDTFTDHGYFIAMSSGEPAQSQVVTEAIISVAAALAEEGADEDEFTRAINPLVTGIETQMRNNSYWLGTVLAASQEKPERIDWARTMLEDYQSITLEEINKLAAHYLTADHAVTLLVTTPLEEPDAGDAAEADEVDAADGPDGDGEEESREAA